MELTKKEIRDIRAYDRDFSPNKIKTSQEARSQEIDDLLVVSLGRRGMHDSGYPFIRIFGRQYQREDKTIIYFDLGWHDHFICNIEVNIDSYGKNVFRVFPWRRQRQWRVSPHFLPVSTFEIGCCFPEIMPENTLF